MDRIRVLIVDDSALMRDALHKGLGADPRLEVVGAAADPYEARDLLVQLQPQVMTLDVEMPRMDGVTFLRKLMPQWPVATVMVSSLTERGASVTLQALEAGAVDFVSKPTAGLSGGLEAMIVELRQKIQVAALIDVQRLRRRTEPTAAPAAKPMATISSPARPWAVIAIGASTGGTEALNTILRALPAGLPPIAIVQHMPPGFTKLFAERLRDTCAVRVSEARDGLPLEPGTAIVAPGGQQMRLSYRSGKLYAQVRAEERIGGHQPSVDPLFRSCIPIARSVVGVMLTGMGGDGAQAMLELRQAGATTLGQDQASSVVYGMPRVAFELGAVQRQLPLDRMADALMRLAQEGRPA